MTFVTKTALGTVGAATVGLFIGLAQPCLAADDPMDACAAIANPDQRLACFDAAMRARGRAPAPEAVQQERRRSFGLHAPNISLPHPHLGGPSQNPSQNADDAVTVELAEVGRSHDDMLWIRTREGVIWRQTDPIIVRVAPEVGSSIQIRRAALDSYFCDMTKWMSVRCERVDQPPP